MARKNVVTAKDAEDYIAMSRTEARIAEAAKITAGKTAVANGMLAILEGRATADTVLTDPAIAAVIHPTRKLTARERVTSKPVASLKSAKSAPVPAKPVKPTTRTCRFGEGAYGSPADSKRCAKAIFELDLHPGHQLCLNHIPVWAAIAKARAATTKPVKSSKATTPKSAGTSKASTPKPKTRVSKPRSAAQSGPVTKSGVSIPMLPPIQRVVSTPAYANFTALDPNEGTDAK